MVGLQGRLSPSHLHLEMVGQADAIDEELVFEPHGRENVEIVWVGEEIAVTYNNNNNDDDKIEISVAYGNYWHSDNNKNNSNANG